MSKIIYIAIIFVFLLFTEQVFAQPKASDFFKNLSKEKNLLNALYNKGRTQNKNGKNKPFTLAGEGGLLSTSGNTDSQIIKLAFESEHEMKHWSNRYDTKFLQRTTKYKNDSGYTEVDTTRVELSGQFDYRLEDPNKRLFVYVEYDDNEFNRLRDQASIVLGWSQVAWKEKKSELRYSIGPGYSHLRQRANNIRIEEGIVRGTLLYNLQFGKGTRFRQTLSAEMGEQIKKAQSQSSISANIFGKLAMKFTVNFVLNKSAVDQKSALSTQTSVSMVYQFF